MTEILLFLILLILALYVSAKIVAWIIRGIGFWWFLAIVIVIGLMSSGTMQAQEITYEQSGNKYYAVFEYEDDYEDSQASIGVFDGWEYAAYYIRGWARGGTATFALNKDDLARIAFYGADHVVIEGRIIPFKKKERKGAKQFKKSLKKQGIDVSSTIVWYGY